MFTLSLYILYSLYKMYLEWWSSGEFFYLSTCRPRSLPLNQIKRLSSLEILPYRPKIKYWNSNAKAWLESFIFTSFKNGTFTTNRTNQKQGRSIEVIMHMVCDEPLCLLTDKRMPLPFFCPGNALKVTRIVHTTSMCTSLVHLCFAQVPSIFPVQFSQLSCSLASSISTTHYIPTDICCCITYIHTYITIHQNHTIIPGTLTLQ